MIGTYRVDIHSLVRFNYSLYNIFLKKIWDVSLKVEIVKVVAEKLRYEKIVHALVP